MALALVDLELQEVIEAREEVRSLAIDAISYRLIARYSRRASVEALWALTSFPVFGSIRRHTSLDEAVEMLAEMAVTIVDPTNCRNSRSAVTGTIDRAGGADG
jgi:EamA domain-containing membrane protein RarD